MIYGVSIPYSSGLSFRVIPYPEYVLPLLAVSQSLIHQVSDSDDAATWTYTETMNNVSIPYSSGLRFRWNGTRRGDNCIMVSIPYSSGLRFRSIKLVMDKADRVSSQSLIHQVSDSDGCLMMRLNYRFDWSQSLIHQVSDSDLY